MKKTSVVVKEKNIYDIECMINNTALIRSVTGKTGLLNIKTNQIIGELDYYYTVYDENEKLYYQVKTIKEESGKKKTTKIRIYDAKNELMLVDGFEVDECLNEHYSFVTLKSPIDRKIHLFDDSVCRQATSIFELGLDSVEYLMNEGFRKNYIVTINGKKGVYTEKKGLKVPIEYDEIEKISNIIIYTKNNYKQFSYYRDYDHEGEISASFDDIIVDENNDDIFYCKLGQKTYIYDVNSQKLLLETNYDTIKYLKQIFYGKILYFSAYIKKKAGLILLKKDNNKIELVKLVKPIYDEIINNYDIFYLKKRDKIGIFVGDDEDNQLIEPSYDKIEAINRNYFAFYTGDFCDIGISNKLTPYNPIVSKCQISKITNIGIIYKKDQKYGIILTDSNIDKFIPNEYKNITFIFNNYFLLDNGLKKGLMNKDKVIIPVEYDDIQFGGIYLEYKNLPLYCSLYKNKKYELVKLHKYDDPEFVDNHIFDMINFYDKIMVLKDQTATYIYNYDEKLLKILPPTSQIVISKNSQIEYYYIDGEYYYYRFDKFEKAIVEENNLYVTTYETDDDIFKASSFDKNVHDGFCEEIDIMEEDEALNNLMELSEKKLTTTTKYPHLILKRIPKNN